MAANKTQRPLPPRWHFTIFQIIFQLFFLTKSTLIKSQRATKKGVKDAYSYRSLMQKRKLKVLQLAQTLIHKVCNNGKKEHDSENLRPNKRAELRRKGETVLKWQR